MTRLGRSADRRPSSGFGDAPEVVVEHAGFFSHLVTRSTGRALRMEIEARLARARGAAVAVLDLTHVVMIDYACADEIVAKIVERTGQGGARRVLALLRGVSEHTREPIQRALARRGLAACAEGTGGRGMLLGEIRDRETRAWEEVTRLGRAGTARTTEAVARRLGTGDRQATEALETLTARGLIFEDGSHYVSVAVMARADTSTAGADDE